MEDEDSEPMEMDDSRLGPPFGIVLNGHSLVSVCVCVCVCARACVRVVKSMYIIHCTYLSASIVYMYMYSTISVNNSL